uniref:NADH-ubiquinone oxidoreductase B17 subunit n=1 Tax=Syphacia muris TaxID=451379 RepID=A0A158R5E5_9BILA
MVYKLWYAVKFTLDTMKGVVVAIASPNMKLPPAKLDPHMPARPWTITQWIRMFAWRYHWRYLPMIRFWVFSALTVTILWVFVVPVKPRHMLIRNDINHKLHELETTMWYGRMQKREDDLYFKKYDPFSKYRIVGHRSH